MKSQQLEEMAVTLLVFEQPLLEAALGLALVASSLSSLLELIATLAHDNDDMVAAREIAGRHLLTVSDLLMREGMHVRGPIGDARRFIRRHLMPVSRACTIATGRASEPVELLTLALLSRTPSE